MQYSFTSYDTYRKYFIVSRVYSNFLIFILRVYFRTGTMERAYFNLGEIKTCVPVDISCLKENGVAHDALKDAQEMWENPWKLDLASQKDKEYLVQLV